MNDALVKSSLVAIRSPDMKLHDMFDGILFSRKYNEVDKPNSSLNIKLGYCEFVQLVIFILVHETLIPSK